MRGAEAAKGRGGRLRRATEEVVASRRLPCGPRARGHAVHLAPRSLRSRCAHRQRVRGRCAPSARWPRSLRSSAPHTRGAACPHAPLLEAAVVFVEKQAPAEYAVAFVAHIPRWISRLAVCGTGSLCGDEERSAGVGARRRRALRPHARWRCAQRDRRERGAKWTARPWREHRSGVGAAGPDRRSVSPCRTPSAATR